MAARFQYTLLKETPLLNDILKQIAARCTGVWNWLFARYGDFLKRFGLKLAPNQGHLAAILAALVLLIGGGAYFALRDTAPSGPTGVTAACKPSGKYELTSKDVALGSKDAPVTFIEYASMTCPHCAAFHGTVMPQLQAQYIDKGHLRYVFREFPLDQVALAAAALARCVTSESYNPFISLLFAQQGNWVRSQDIRGALQELARRVGMTSAEFDACLIDKPVIESIRKTAMDGESMYCIHGTPTGVLNGRVVAAETLADFETFDAELRKEFKALGKSLPAPVTAATPPAEAPAGTGTETAAPANPVGPVETPVVTPPDSAPQPAPAAPGP
jgi:protein-disulfide isomerase